MDVALVKYRVAAVACLKRAVYFTPFEWIISYNLGKRDVHGTGYRVLGGVCIRFFLLHVPSLFTLGTLCLFA
jgi:hypothetical protein